MSATADVQATSTPASPPHAAAPTEKPRVRDDFRVIVGENDPDQGQTHVLHLDDIKNTVYSFNAPIKYAREFAEARLFREGYWIGPDEGPGTLLIRLQRKVGEGQWADYIPPVPAPIPST